MTRNIQQPNTNSSSTQIVEVPTAAGFNAGDLVYYQNGDYKGLPSLTGPTSGNFPLIQTVPNIASSESSSVFTSYGATAYSGVANGKFAAVLTNGNIAQVWMNDATATPYFRVVDSTGAQVVAPTQISASIMGASYASITVAALTGGGFVVCWYQTTYAVQYAIYTNAGAVTTASAADATLGTAATGSIPALIALPNGGFFIAVKASTTSVKTRAYGSTGTGTYAAITTTWTTLSSAIPPVALAARSDSSVLVYDVTTTNFRYYIYDATGALLVTAATFTSTLGSTSYPTRIVDAAVLSDGTTFVLVYQAGNAATTNAVNNCFKLLPTGNTLGAETAIPYQNLSTGSLSSYALPNLVQVQALSAGGFIFVFTDCYQQMQYAFFNSSGVVQSGSNATGILPKNVQQTYVAPLKPITMLEVGSNINVYWYPMPYNTAGSSSAAGIRLSMSFLQINKTTYATVLNSNSTALTSTALGVSATYTGGSPSGSKPTNMAFAQGTTGNLTQLVTAGTVVLSQTVLDSGGACNSLASCTLPNGNIVVVWARSGTIYTAYINGTTGAVIRAATANGVAVVAATATDNSTISICALTNNIVVIATQNGTGTNLYLTAINVTTGSYINQVSPNGGDVAVMPNYAIAALSNGNLVCVWQNDVAYGPATGQVYAQIFTSGLVNVGSASIVSAVTTLTNIFVAGNGSGGFAFGLWNGGNFIYYTVAVLGSTYSSSAGQSLASYASGPLPGGMVSNLDSDMLYFWYKSSGATSQQVFSNGQNSVSAITFGSSVLGQYKYITGGLNGFGYYCAAYTSTTSNLVLAPLGPTMVNNVTTPFGSGNNPNANITWSSATDPMLSMTPAVGPYIAVVGRNSSSYVTIGIYNATGFYSVVPVTAGVTPSGTTYAINPTSTSSSTTVPNTVLAGVAATTTAAGTAGQLIINGPAQLNSSYPASNTGAFDYTGQGVNGVKGVYNGRNINLQGNS